MHACTSSGHPSPLVSRSSAASSHDLPRRYFLAALSSLAKLLFSSKFLGNFGKLYTTVRESVSEFQDQRVRGRIGRGLGYGLGGLASGTTDWLFR